MIGRYRKMSDIRKSEAEKRQSLADPTYKGNDYFIDTDIEKGPLTNRRCTDLFCLVLFFLATGGAGYIGFYAIENGSPERIMAPMDGDGHFCGRESGYEGHPYLLFTNLGNLRWTPYGVCVSECPAKTATTFDCKTTRNVGSCEFMGYTYESSLFLERWCLPIYDSLDEEHQEYYNNIIGTVGLDDIQM